MNDSLNQNIYLDVDRIHLKAASLNDLQHEGNGKSVALPLSEFLCLFQAFGFQSTKLSTSWA